MNAKETLMNSLTVVSAVCAIAVGGRYLLHDSSQKPPATARAQKRAIDGWESLLTGGRRIGPANARFSIVEFGDFECPSCAAYSRVLDSVRARYPNDFAIVFHHLPLPYHRLAYPLARASECAAQQGRFPEFHDWTFAGQAKLGILPISEIGAQIKVADTLAFRRCALDTARVARIEEDVTLAKRLDLPGTPSLIVEGVLHGPDLTARDLELLMKQKLVRLSSATRGTGPPTRR